MAFSRGSGHELTEHCVSKLQRDFDRQGPPIGLRAQLICLILWRLRQIPGSVSQAVDISGLGALLTLPPQTSAESRR